jgi:hypothetical protein
MRRIPADVRRSTIFKKALRVPGKIGPKVPFERNFRYSYRVNLRYRLPTPKPALADPKGYPAARRQSQIESHVVDSNRDRQSIPIIRSSSGPLARRSERQCIGQMHCLQKFAGWSPSLCRRQFGRCADFERIGLLFRDLSYAVAQSITYKQIFHVWAIL